MAAAKIAGGAAAAAANIVFRGSTSPDANAKGKEKGKQSCKESATR